VAIDVEDGTGKTTSNSYASVAEATSYFAVDPTTSFWAGLTLTQQENYLQWATRILDAKTEWNGRRYKETQSLAWPRSGAYDREQYAIGVSVIPKPVKAATFELVKWLQNNDPTSGPDVQVLKKLTVDVVEIEYQDEMTQTSFPSIINAILFGLGTFRSGGSTSARIIKG